ncbi:MAG: hypothetical protein IJJ26_12165 [Victivallales bacterium]|nr:hypothetical protein [Victivallales bacterium]
MSFTTETIELSMYSVDNPTQKLQATVYKMDGVTDEMGQPRLMSIGQLVMAICLQRAASLESDIITLMESINRNSSDLAALTEVEQALVDYFSTGANGPYTLSDHTIQDTNSIYYGQDYQIFLQNRGVIDNAVKWVYLNGIPTPGQDILYDDLINSMENKMDSLNTLSQETLIELQSLTTKRDQTYDMVSNILKTFYNQMMGNINNM